MDAGRTLQAILLGTVQDHRCRRVGERGLSRPCSRNARPGRPGIGPGWHGARRKHAVL